jgi:hypothetical protein
MPRRIHNATTRVNAPIINVDITNAGRHTFIVPTDFNHTANNSLITNRKFSHQAFPSPYFSINDPKYSLIVLDIALILPYFTITPSNTNGTPPTTKIKNGIDTILST